MTTNSIDSINLNIISNKNEIQLSTSGKILLGITGGAAIAITVISVPFLSPALRKFCLPYIPATTKQIENVLIALKGKQGTLLDLGSGDGRIVFESAKNNFTSHGIELNPWLVLYSKLESYRSRLQHKTKFFRGDLWKFDISKYDNIVIFGVEQMMSDLERKLSVECKRGCNIIACRFPLPNTKPLKTIGSGVDTVWIYNISG